MADGSRAVLITGCSSGIGLDAARGLRARGWRVFAACRKQADCDRLQAEGFDSPLIDYDDPARIEGGLSQVLDATGGRLDALFNNGAYGMPCLVEDLPVGALQAMFQTNLFGWHDLTRRVIPVMRAQGAGRIVQCSSGLGLVAYRWRGAYVATKFALEGMTDVLRIEMRGTGIHVVLIEPGPIRTAFRQNAVPHFERWVDWRASARSADYRPILDRLYTAQGPGLDRFELPPAAVTAKLIHALESPRPRPRYYVTWPTWIGGTLRRVLPTRAIDWIVARV